MLKNEFINEERDSLKDFDKLSCFKLISASYKGYGFDVCVNKDERTVVLNIASDGDEMAVKESITYRLEENVDIYSYIEEGKFDVFIGFAVDTIARRNKFNSDLNNMLK